MPAWKKKALEAGNSDPMAAPFGGDWTTESSLAATEDTMQEQVGNCFSEGDDKGTTKTRVAETQWQSICKLKIHLMDALSSCCYTCLEWMSRLLSKHVQKIR